jgi:translation initiation factor 4G
MQQQQHIANGPGMYGGYPQGPFQHQQVRITSHTLNNSSSNSESSKACRSADSSQSSQQGPGNGGLSTATATPQSELRLPVANESNAFLRAVSSPFSPVSNGYDQSLTQMRNQNMYGVPAGNLDPYQGYYAQQPAFGMQHSIHYPGAIPPSPGRGQAFPQQMHGYHGGMPPYAPPQQAPGMSRTPSNMSERPPSAVAQPSTPAMTNVNHVSHTHTPSVGSNSPAPGASNFTIPPKKKSSAIVIKNADGEIVDFNKKATSPAPPPQTRAPVIASTPTPPPRTPSVADSSHTRTESRPAQSDEERKAIFVKQFHDQIKEKDKEKADKDKEAQESKAKAEQESKAKAEQESKAKAEQESKVKAEAEAKALKEKADAEAKAAAEKEEADKAAKEQEAAEAAKKAEEATKKAADDEAEKKRLEDEETERMIAELEAQEREEEERERAYQEKKKIENEAKKAKEAERLKLEDEKLKQQEREAEALEEARSKETPEQKAERESLFAGLKKNTQFGPAATGATDSGASTPPAEPAAPVQPTQPKALSAPKQKPVPLKLETNKTVEPPQPTAGMQALKSARFLQVKNESINYPDGIKSPNPALNLGSKSKGRQYDKDFLLQFQEVFKEKPSMDWDMKLKETVGDGSESARPQSARPGSMMSGRQPSARSSMAPSGGPMGNFGQPARTLPPGTTSDQRFNASMGRPTMSNPLAGLANRPGGFPVPTPMQRTASFQQMGPQGGPNSPRNTSRRGGGGDSRRGPKQGGGGKGTDKDMPLTAGADLKPLERSQTGWKPHSQAPAAPVMGAAHMAPDMVQRKVKAALNKMTPEKFDKIADQILEIAAQSKDESDGRTLRQVIQLTFEKACDEAHWASMYAKFCHRMLATMSPEIKDENVRDKHDNPVLGGALFRKYLLNRCQEEFERGWEVNLPTKPEGQTEEAALLSDEYYIAAAAKRKGLGLIQFIGELYKLGMLTLRIMHECVLKLLDFEGLPDESAIESLVKLLRTVGATMEQTETGPKMIAVYFERIEKIMNMEGLPSRLQFMLLDIADLRKGGWRSKDDAKGPKTIAEIRNEALQAAQAQEMERNRSNQRGGPRSHMGRGDARSFSGGGMMPPPDYPSGRVQMDDLRKLSKGASGRNLNSSAALGPSMLGSRSGSGRRGLGPGGLMGRGDESGASSRTATPPTQKEKESTKHVNSFSALAALESEGAGEVGSPPSTASSPPVQKAVPAASRSSAVEAKDSKPSE